MHHTRPSVVLGAILAFVVMVWASSAVRAQSTHPQILFVCEHGNVKSLMAASYFNELAKKRNLPHRAVSRGSAPDSTSVPPKIVDGLHGDGFDVATYRPTAVTAADISSSQHVVLINTDLPVEAQAIAAETERWLDVPPASTDYAAARQSLKSHIANLIDRLARDVPR